MKISVVIAAYNEAENIGPLTARLVSTLSALDDSTWELIYVIEGTDETRSIAETFANRHPQINILYNPEPSGLSNAFRKGFASIGVDSDVVVTMDADLNHQPEEIPRLVDALLSRHADIVVGSRKVTGSTTSGTPFWKRTLSDSFNRSMRSLIGMPVADMTSGYRVYRAAIVPHLSFDNSGFAFLPEILMRAHAAGRLIVEEPIQFIFRVAGDSKMKLLPTVTSYLKLLSTRFFSLWTLVAAFVIVTGLLIRLFLAYPVHKFQADADAVLAGLCGIDVLHGHHPVFFPGGYRLGAQSCYAAAASFSLFGTSRGALAVVGILFSTLFVLFMYWYLKEAFGPRAGVIGLLVAALPPLQIIINTYVVWAYGEILMYCASTLWLACLVTRKKTRDYWFFLLGLSAGLAFWCSAQTLMVTMPIAFWLLLRRILNKPIKIALTALGLFVGVSPLWIFVLRHGAAPILGDGAAHPINTLSQLTDNGSYLIFHVLPWLLVDRQGSELSLLSGTTALIAVYAIAAVTVLCLSIWPNSNLRRRPELLWQTLLLGMIAGCCSGLFVLSAAGSIRGWTVRYILPLYLVVPAMAAILSTSLKKTGQWVALGCVAFLLCMNLREYPFEGSPLRQSLDSTLLADRHLIKWLKQEGVQAVVGDYWNVYSLNFDSNKSIAGVPLSPHDDYFKFGELNSKTTRWALVDNAPNHLQEWEHRLNLRGRTVSFGTDRYIFVPDSSSPMDAKAFLSFARASESTIPTPENVSLASYSQEIASEEHEFSVKAGATYLLQIRVRNTGTQPWLGSGLSARVDASYRWINSAGDVLPIEGSRAALHRPVTQPGESDQLELKVTAPPIAGQYRLRVSMVQEGVDWFFARGGKPLDVKATVR